MLTPRENASMAVVLVMPSLRVRKPPPSTCVLFLARLLIFVCMSVMHLTSPVHSDSNVSFALSTSLGPGSRVGDAFRLYGSYAVEQDGVVLIRDIEHNFTTARLMYSNPVQFYNASAGSVASFRTWFVFTISNSTEVPGNGLAFFITRTLQDSPPYSAGGTLGLFQGNKTGDPVDGTTKLVAIDMDTVVNVAGYDEDYAPHVGLDINSLRSISVSSPSSIASEIRNGSSVGVKIEYSAPREEINVSISVTVAPAPPREEDAELVLTYPNFNLSAFINESSYVGFSAASGSHCETNIISEWNFSTTFLPGVAQKSEPAPAPPSAAAGRSNLGAVVGLGVGLPAALLVLCCWLGLRWRHKQHPSGWWRKGSSGQNGSQQLQLLPKEGFGARPMAYNSLMKATKGFSTTILGEGGFGAVYKGFLVDGSEVAVKRIKQRTRNGEKQFLAEVTTIGRLSHKNLVPLKGWCYEHDELLIVYEYMPKGSLADHLYPQPAAGLGAPLGLDWLNRRSIIRGVADALEYLHEGSKQSVVHRDIKPSNVMLDANLVPKLGDFGLAVAMQQDKHSQTVSRPAGTPGYQAPECLSNPRVGPVSDVYGFGIMVLETTKRDHPFELGVETAHCTVCPSIRAECKQEDAEMLLHLGLMCTFPDPSNRPSMRTVTRYLEGSIEMPPLPRETPLHFAQFPQTPQRQGSGVSSTFLTTQEWSPMYVWQPESHVSTAAMEAQ